MSVARKTQSNPYSKDALRPLELLIILAPNPLNLVRCLGGQIHDQDGCESPKNDQLQNSPTHANPPLFF
jgi:hypothetical protein